MRRIALLWCEGASSMKIFENVEQLRNGRQGLSCES